MSDLEQRLTEALTEGAEGAPTVSGLSSAARSRARSRRRTRVAGAAAAVALAVGVPTAVVATQGSDSDPDGESRVASDSNTEQGVPDGYRVESWHDVSIEVPDTWGYGSRDTWCAGGGSLDTPRVSRPGGVSEMIACSPATGYGITFQEIDNGDDFQWPVVQQPGNESYPPGAYVGGRGIGGVLVMVTAKTQAAGLDVLATMRAIGPAGDANGCQSRYTPGSTDPPEGALSVCRYDENGALEQSEALFGEDAGHAVRALQAAPEPGECADTSQASQTHQVVVMEAAGISAIVDLVGGCPRVTVDGQVRELTPDVVYWALSPGWTGSVPDGVSLPSELRSP
jgi:hypothetical protein